MLVLPDFIVNAGGVICGAVEYRGGSENEALSRIDEKIRHNLDEVLSRAKADDVIPRAAAVAMARERVTTAMRFRRRG